MPDKVALELASQISNQNLSKEGWTTYYVDGTNGNDGANGLTWNSAFATIQHAVDTTESWGKIYVKAGTYAEEVIITKNNIQLLAASQWVTIQPGTDYKPLVISADQCTIKNIFADADSPTNTGAIEITGDLNQLIDCKVSNGDFRQGIRIDGDKNYVYNLRTSNIMLTSVLLYGSENLFESCYFTGLDTSDFCFAIQSGSHKNRIFNCDIENFNKAGAFAFKLFSGSHYNMVYHNNFINNDTDISNYGTSSFIAENFYDSHTTDTNNDGITDTPYTFTTGTDHTPVSKRNGWKQISLGNVAGSSIAEIEANIGDFQAQTNLRTILAALGIPDVAGKPLYTTLVTDRLDNATFGLSAIETLVDDLETRLSAVRADYLDELAAANLPADIDAILADTGILKPKIKTFNDSGTDSQLTNANGAAEVTIKTFDKTTYGAGVVKAFKIDLDKVTSGFQTLAEVDSTIKIRVYEKIDGTNYRLRTDDGQSYTWTQGVTGDKVAELDDISFSEDCDIRAVLSIAPTGTIDLPWLCEFNKNMEI